MAVSTHPIGSNRHHGASTPDTILVKIGAKARAALKALQVARMASTLSNMHDGQLKQIGITRAEIPKYAEKLIAEE